MKKSLFFLSFFTLALGVASGQGNCTLNLNGQVLDEFGKGLPGATIFIKEMEIGRVSDVNGKFLFENLCAGKYTLEIKFLGYESYENKFKLDKSEELFIPLTPAEEVLNEIIISDHAVNVGKANNFSTLTSQEFEERKGKSLGETLQGITGVNSIQTGPAIFKPVIHGVHSQRILILNNGIRQEGQQWGAEHAPEIDPFIATNLVVIKDAGALKYGTDALGGVIIVTPSELPTNQKLGGQFHLIGNSNGRGGIVSGLLEGGVKNLNGWGWRLQGTGKKFGDSHAADYNLSNTGYEELNFSTALGYHKERKGIEVFYSHFNTTIGILRGSATSSTEDLANAIEREPPQYTEDFTYSIESPRQEVKHDLIKLNGHVRSGKNLFNLQYGLQINNRKEFDVRRGALEEIPALGYILYTQTLDADWQITKSDKHSRNLGVNGMWQDNNKIDGTQTLPFIPNFTNYSAGLFWIEKISVNKWDWDLGARYDFKLYNVAGYDYRNQLYKSQLSFHNISGTIGSTYKINQNSSITSNIGSTWRPPNVAELYSLGTHQSAAAIEYGLLLDESTNQVLDIDAVNFKTEQALKWVNTYRLQKGKWIGELSGYINYIFNYTYLKPRGVTESTRGVFPYFRYTQTDASFLGTDLSLHYSLNRSFSINTKISLLKATDETNNDYLIFIPSNRYELAVRYEKNQPGNWLNLYAEARVKYVAEQYRAPRVVPIQDIIDAKEQGIDLFIDDNRNFDFVAAPSGYFLGSFSTGITKPVKNSRVAFRFSVENLFNASY
ncbi:MAG TPA: TonB-dependent receptor, partial [Cyclobacteriaceae bacterium]|nr:TonB-dependent receptor [Cyclobacteriaceae bacterium]